MAVRSWLLVGLLAYNALLSTYNFGRALERYNGSTACPQMGER